MPPPPPNPQPPGLSLLFREKHSVQWCRTVQGDVTVAASFAPVLSFARWPRAQPHCRLGNRMQKRLNTGRLRKRRRIWQRKHAHANTKKEKKKMSYKRTQPSKSNKTAKVFPVEKIGLSTLYTLLTTVSH